MINRIRDVRRERAMTLADVAARCAPPTTAQTIGRLETGMRTLSLGWLNRIAAALDVAPELLVRGEGENAGGNPPVVARLGAGGAEALAEPAEALLPIALTGAGRRVAVSVEVGVGAYHEGDQVWLREVSEDDWARQVNRDVLAPRRAGRFAFGRLVGVSGAGVTILPPGHGQREIEIAAPAWLAVAEMLARRL